jgi:hypothetical protein
LKGYGFNGMVNQVEILLKNSVVRILAQFLRHTQQSVAEDGRYNIY